MNLGLSTSVIQRGKTGVAQYVFALVRALQPYTPAHRLTLFVLAEDLPLLAFAKNFAELIPVPEKWRPAVRNVFWHQFVLPRLARQHQLDALHVPSYRRMLWRGPCPLVATIHDLAPFHVARKYSRARMFYGRVVAKYLAKRQHRIIAISHNTAADIRRFFHVEESRLVVIHNGIDHSRFKPALDNSAREWAADRYGLKDPFFLYTARLEHPAKNHVRLIEAFTAFRRESGLPWQLVFAGSDWHGAENIHAAIQSSPETKAIHCLGFVPDQELPSLYQAADVFIYPSMFEGFGLPPLEAMACGCPVISSSRGSLGEIVKDAAQIVDPEDTAAITGAMRGVATDSNLRNLLRAKGFARAGSFRWEKTAAQTIAVYEAAVKDFGCRKNLRPEEPAQKRGFRSAPAGTK